MTAAFRIAQMGHRPSLEPSSDSSTSNRSHAAGVAPSDARTHPTNPVSHAELCPRMYLAAPPSVRVLIVDDWARSALWLVSYWSSVAIS